MSNIQVSKFLETKVHRKSKMKFSEPARLPKEVILLYDKLNKDAVECLKRKEKNS